MYKGFIGKYVIVRSSASGVHAGVLESVEQTGDTLAVVLSSSRRLWRWWAGGNGVSLDGVAEDGLDEKHSAEIRVSTIQSNPKAVAGCCEMLTCSPVGEASIRSWMTVRS